MAGSPFNFALGRRVSAEHAEEVAKAEHVAGVSPLAAITRCQVGGSAT